MESVAVPPYIADERFGRLARARHWVEALWGYDVFIAHRRIDGATFASALHSALIDDQIRAFIDAKEYGPGDHLGMGTRSNARRSSVLVFLASPQILARREPDWLAEELEAYLASHADPKVLVVDFERTIEDGQVHPLARKVADFVRLPCELAALKLDPSADIVMAIKRLLGGRRVERTRLRWIRSIAVAMFLLAIATAVGAFLAMQQRDEAKARAGQALAARAQQLLEQPVNKETAPVIAALAVQSWKLSHSPDAWNALQRLPWTGQTISLGKGSWVKSIAFNPQSAAVATASAGDVRIFDAHGIARHAIHHEGWVNDIAFSRDGKLLVTGGGRGGIGEERPNGFVRVFRLEGSAVEEIINLRLNSPVQTMAIAADGRHLAMVDQKGAARLFALDGSRNERIGSSHAVVSSVAFDVSGKRLALAENIAKSGTVRALDLATGVWDVLLSEPSADFQFVKFAPNESRFGAPMLAVAATKADGKSATRLINVLHKTRHGELTHQGKINAVAFSHDGRLLASAAEDNRLLIADLQSGTIEGFAEVGHTDSVTTLAFGSDGRFIATGSRDGTTRIISVNDYRVVALIDNGPRVRGQSGGSRIDAVAFDDTGQRLGIAGEFGTAQIVPITPGLAEQVFVAHDATVRAVAFDSTGRLFASGSVGGVVKLTEIGSRKVLSEFLSGDPVTALAFGQGGSLAIGHEEKGIRIVRADRLSSGSTPFMHSENIVGLMYSPDKRFLAGATLDGKIQIRGPTEGKPIWMHAEEKAGPPSLVFSADSSHLGIGIGYHSGKGMARILDMTGCSASACGKATELPVDHRVTALALSPKGRWLALAQENSNVLLFSLTDRSGYRLRASLLCDNAAEVSFDRDGEVLAAACANGVVQLVKMSQISAVTSAGAYISLPHQEKAKSLAFSPDGQIIATASYDQVRLFKTTTGREIMRISHLAEVNSLVFTSDGRFLGTSSGTDPGAVNNNRLPRKDDRSARVWITDPDQMFQRLCNGPGRNLNSNEWAQQFRGAKYETTCVEWKSS